VLDSSDGASASYGQADIIRIAGNASCHSGTFFKEARRGKRWHGNAGMSSAMLTGVESLRAGVAYRLESAAARAASASGDQ
jgi:hypothetical protein